MRGKQGRTVRSVAVRASQLGLKIGRSTCHHLVSGEGSPSKNMLVAFLTACDTVGPAQQPWLDAYDRMCLGEASRPARKRSSGWVMAGEQARVHFTRRSRGYRDDLAVEDLFRGRSAAMQAVTGWVLAEQPHGTPMVITGQPGAGKSALLARVVLHAEASGAQVRGAAVRGLAVHARGATFAEVLAPLTKVAGLRPTANADDVLDALHGSDGPVLVVAVDALDEVSGDVDRREIVKLLVGLALRPWLRVVVATRALGSDRYAFDALLPALGVRGPRDRQLVDLDSDAYFDPAGLREFVTAVLTQDLPGGVWEKYRGDPALTGRLAAEVAGRAGRNYLVAALAATDLGGQDSIVDPHHHDFDPTRIPSTVGEAITKYLDTLRYEQQAATEALLMALAYARGDGIDDPRWQAFAGALRYPTTALDLHALRKSPAAGYLLHTTSDHSGRVTRLFHQALTDELLTARGHRRGDEKAILATLLPATADGWAQVDAYTRAHASEHAHAAGEFPDLLHEPAFLCSADLTRLEPLLPDDPEPADAAIAAVLRCAADQASRLPDERRAAHFALAAAHLRVPDLQQRFNTHVRAGLPVAWAHTFKAKHEDILGRIPTVYGVAAGRWGDRDVIVSAHYDCAVRVWNSRGKSIGKPLTGHSSTVSAVAVGRLGDDDVIISGSYDCTVRVWDSLGQPVGEALTGHTSTVSAVAVGRLGDRDVIVSVSEGGTVRVWDSLGQPVGEPLMGHTGTVSAVAVGRLGDHNVIVFAGTGTRVWDSLGQAVGEPLSGHTDFMCTVAVGRLGDRDVIVSGAWDGTVRVWDSLGRPIGEPLTGHTSFVHAVAVGRLGDRDVIVSGGADGTIRIADGATVMVLDTPGEVRGLAVLDGIICATNQRALYAWGTPRHSAPRRRQRASK